MNLVIQEPNEKQIRFLKADKKYISFGGARGGGKSWSVRTKTKLLAVRYSKCKILIVRRTYPELINNHINPLQEELHGIAKYNKQEKVFTFPNGSTIKFGYCNNDNDVMQYQGAEYDFIFIDEATNLKWEWIEKIIVACRGTNNIPKRVYFTMNPGGVSHSQFKRLFIDRKFEGNENPDDYEFIQSLVTDNKALMKSQPEYIETLKNLPPKLRKAWLEGDWNIFEGQFFEDFRIDPDVKKAVELGIDAEDLRSQHRWCHVIKPFEIPRHWNIYRSYDFGYSKPFSCAWWAYDGEVLYRIMELYGSTDTPNEGIKWSPDEQFRKIREIETTHPWFKGKKIDGPADPAIWDSSRGESIAETAVKHGVYFRPGDNGRINGWMQMHYRLQFDENGYARMYVFDNCKAFIRTVPTLMYSETHVEDLDTSMEDHVADETRYMCMDRPVKPMVPVKPRQILSDPLNQFK